MNGSPSLQIGLKYLRKMEARSPLGAVRRIALLASAFDLFHWAAEQRLDHIHGHSCANTAHILALARLMGGPPYSLTLHGDLNVYGGDYKLKLANVEFVCAVGNHLRAQLIEKAGIAEHKIIVTCMGVETADLKLLGKDRNYKSGVLKLLTVARLERTKGHLHALAAIHKARQAGLEVSYTIAGGGSFRREIDLKIRELGLVHCVSLTGTLSEPEVYRLLANSDAFLLPSVGLGEASPVSVMEAMAAGLPVISSAIGATPDMISSGVDGILVPQADEQGIFENIALLANDVEVRRRIGDAARITAQRRFDACATASVLRDAMYASRRT